jgi:ribokinase
MNLPDLSDGTLVVWGEPTVCDIAVCSTPFQRDGSVSGAVSRWFGGSAYATAIGARRLGAKVRLHGPFGSDPEGQGALTFALAEGLEVQPIDAGTTRRTVIVVDTDGSRSMVGGRGDSFLKPWADSVERLDGAVCHVSLSSVVRDGTRAVERLITRSACEVLSLDLGSESVIREVGNERLAALVSTAQRVLMFANADEARAIRDVAGDVVGAAWCFVHRDGANGATARFADGSVFAQVQPGVQVVDTTGAGDAFAAGFLASWLTGERNVAAALRAAHTHAAEVVTRVGTV